MGVNENLNEFRDWLTAELRDAIEQFNLAEMAEDRAYYEGKSDALEAVKRRYNVATSDRGR